MVEGGGFEPPKAPPTDLQSVPFGRSGTPPLLQIIAKNLTVHYIATFLLFMQQKNWSWRWDLNPQPPDYKSGALPIELRQHY